MTRSDWLAVAGIGLSILFGVPTVPFLLHGSPGLAFIALLLAAGVALLTIYLYWYSGLPPWTVLSHHAVLEIRDKDGKTATWRKTLKLRCNYGQLQHYRHRGFVCDGTAGSFRVDPNAKIIQQIHPANIIEVTVEFPGQVKRFGEVTTWLETDCTDTFLDNPEWLTLTVEEPVKSAMMEVLLPSSRPPVSAKAFYRYAGLEQELPDPQIANNRITWTRTRMLRPIPYGQYKLLWNW